LALGHLIDESSLSIYPINSNREGLMPEQENRKRRTNRVYKSLHKPLTYLGLERTLFYFVCVGAVGAFNLFNSILAGIGVFIGGFAFGHWVTSSDPAFLRILAKSEKYKLRYDAAKQGVPRVEVV
jgi:type IV secretory pathway TrbD component